MIKQLPNILTLSNLLFGCAATVFALQHGIIYTNDLTSGELLVEVPEKLYVASLLIATAAVIDFFDGFVARWVNASSEMGKQLDSLADVVSFGVAPSAIIYQFLKLSFAQLEDGLSYSSFWMMPAFCIAVAGAYRLARFNIDTSNSDGFKGVPIPAVGLLIASFPLVYWTTTFSWVATLFTSITFWYVLILLLSFLMMSTLPMRSLKFKSFDKKSLTPFAVLIIIAIFSSVFLGWLSVSVVFISYVIVSLLFKQ